MREISFKEIDELERKNYQNFLEKLLTEERESIEKKIGYPLPNSDFILSNKEYLEKFPKISIKIVGQFRACQKTRGPSLLICLMHMLWCPVCRESFLRGMSSMN